MSVSAHIPTAPDTTSIRNVVIIGSGPAGLTAAIYAARARLKPLVISGFSQESPKGGQLMQTTEVENYPGFPKGIHGQKMMYEFEQQAIHHGAEMLDGCNVERVDFSQRPFTLFCDNDQVLKAKAVIIATGARANWLGCKGEEQYKNMGVSACAVCDGALPIFRDKDLIVVGGGDTACEEATYLTKFASRVYLAVRRDQLRASKAMQDRLKSNPKITILWNTVVEEILGQDFVTGAVIKDVKTGQTRKMAVGGVFMAIGHTPNTQPFKGIIDMDEKGYIKPKWPGRTYTNVEGVFVAGDAADNIYRQAVTAAGTGCAAALDCERWLESQGGH